MAPLLKCCTNVGLGWALVLGAQAAGPSDPFHPPTGPDRPAAKASADPTPASPSQPGLHLEGLRIGRQNLALFDGHWLAAGQSVAGATVLAVQRKGVTLRLADGNLLQLSLSGDAVAQPSTLASPRVVTTLAALPANRPADTPIAQRAPVSVAR